MGRNEVQEPAETVRSLRARTGLTQIGFAERAGLAVRTYAELEAGRRGTAEQIRKCAKAAGVPSGRWMDAMDAALVLKSLSHFRLSHPARKGRIA